MKEHKIKWIKWKDVDYITTDSGPIVSWPQPYPTYSKNYSFSPKGKSEKT